MAESTSDNVAPRVSSLMVPETVVPVQTTPTKSDPPSLEMRIDGDEVLPSEFDENLELPSDLHETRERRHIFIFLDGTWNEERNERGRATPTNVLRMFQEISKAAQRQDESTGEKIVAKYYRGIGCKQNNNFVGRYWLGFTGNDEALIRAAAFVELFRDIRSAADSIYILGFSRGAACARLLVRELYKLGLPPRLEVIKSRTPNLLTGQIESRVAKYARVNEPQNTALNHRPKIKFLGCWDTVDAFTLPSRFPNNKIIAEAYRAIQYVAWPKVFGEKRSTVGGIPVEVEKAVHCLAIDETRNAFLPSLMLRADNVEEVWFPGVHADVGGGYEEGSLAHAPYRFMRARLFAAMKKQGLRLDLLFDESVSDRERLRPYYCFHFHGMNTDVEQIKDIVGFGTRERKIRVLTMLDNSTDKVGVPQSAPKVHVSTFAIMNSGDVFASDKRDKRTWNINYDPYNVAILKGKFESVDEKA